MVQVFNNLSSRHEFLGLNLHELVAELVVFLVVVRLLDRFATQACNIVALLSLGLSACDLPLQPLHWHLHRFALERWQEVLP